MPNNSSGAAGTASRPPGVLKKGMASLPTRLRQYCMVHLTDHMGGKTCCSLAVCAQFVQRKVILAYCELDKP